MRLHDLEMDGHNEQDCSRDKARLGRHLGGDRNVVGAPEIACGRRSEFLGPTCRLRATSWKRLVPFSLRLHLAEWAQHAALPRRRTPGKRPSGRNGEPL